MSSPTDLAQPDRPPWVRLAVSTLFLTAGVFLFGPTYLTHFRPPDGLMADFVQEWLSARNFFVGQPIYEPQSASAARHLPQLHPPGATFFLPYNAHPPGSVLVALPFAGLNYWDAHLSWNLVTSLLYVLAIGVAVCQLCRPFRGWHLLPLAAVVVWAEPVRATIIYGQLNFLLAFCLTMGWAFDRRGKEIPAGVCVGLAAGLKLFPAAAFAYFLFSGRWRGLLAGVLTAVVVNGVAAGVFGVEAFQDYVRDVLPSLKAWEGSWPNDSLNGVWVRAVDPPPQQAGSEAFRSPMLAKGGYGFTAAVVMMGVAWAGWRARKEGDPDVGWAAAVIALPLVSPVAWQHYYAVCVVPLAVLAARLGGWRRAVGWVTVAGLSVKDIFYCWVLVSKSHFEKQSRTMPFFMPLDPVEVLLGTGVITYCGLVLFILAVTLPRRAESLTPGRPPGAAGPSPASAGTPVPSPPPGP